MKFSWKNPKIETSKNGKEKTIEIAKLIIKDIFSILLIKNIIKNKNKIKIADG